MLWSCLESDVDALTLFFFFDVYRCPTFFFFTIIIFVWFVCSSLSDRNRGDRCFHAVPFLFVVDVVLNKEGEEKKEHIYIYYNDMEYLANACAGLAHRDVLIYT